MTLIRVWCEPTLFFQYKHTNTTKTHSPLVSIVLLLSLFPLFSFFIRCCTTQAPHLGYCLLFPLLRYSSSTTTTIVIISAITLPFYRSWSFSLFCFFVFSPSRFFSSTRPATRLSDPVAIVWCRFCAECLGSWTLLLL